MSRTTTRILLTEDDPRLSELLVAGLTRAGWAVDAVETAAEAHAALATVSYQALILDLGLPDGDGMRLLKDVRLYDRQLPILIMTARGRLSERVNGLNAGADDYLVKPFALEELVARIRARSRRADVPAEMVITRGRISLVPASRTFCVDKVAYPLARREMMVLEILLKSDERLVPKEILENALGSFDHHIGSNAIEVYVSRLRRRLAALDAGASIRAERGLGYRLVTDVP